MALKRRTYHHRIDDTELRDLLINPKLNRTGQYICDCPFCGKSKHFYVSKAKQAWDCKKCGESGGIYKLLKFLDKTYLLGGKTVEVTDQIDSIRSIRAAALEETEEIFEELPEIKMPAGWKVYDRPTEYLRGRGLTAEDCERYEIGHTKLLSKYKNYLLIPVRDGGKIRGFIGRYGAKDVPDDKLRYQNSIGVAFAELLFGYDEIDDNEATKTVILVEGVFDKMAVDRFLRLWESVEVKCVCTFGKKISKVQELKLVEKGVTNVILLYDFDAVGEMKKYGVELNKNFFTKITFTTKKDIDECNEDEALEVFSRLYTPMEFNHGVIGKLKGK